MDEAGMKTINDRLIAVEAEQRTFETIIGAIIAADPHSQLLKRRIQVGLAGLRAATAELQVRLDDQPSEKATLDAVENSAERWIRLLAKIQ